MGMFLDIVQIVQKNVEFSIKRLGMDGIKILNLVIPKPDIPRDIAANYKAVKVQWTEQLVATQQQKTEKIKKETEIIKDREENKANVESYRKQKVAEANKNLYTDTYVKLEMAKALSENTKFYFSGETSPLGSLLNKLLGE